MRICVGAIIIAMGVYVRVLCLDFFKTEYESFIGSFRLKKESLKSISWFLKNRKYKYF